MATNLNESGMTSFGGSTSNRGGSMGLSTLVFSRFFSKVFANKARPALADLMDPTAPKPIVPPMAGDAVIHHDSIAAPGAKSHGLPILTETEINRKNRYKEFEIMDEYPEIGAAFDIYADDCTQKSLKGERWEIITDDNFAKQEIEDLFDNIRMQDHLWDITRNTVKFGDNFIELIVDLNKPKEGIKKIKILDPKYIFRIENEYGALLGFVQQIPRKADWEAFGQQGETLANSEYIALSKYQIIHFRLLNSDPAFYPYGKSIAALARQTFRSLKLMEDAMLIYRLSRAPERRIFYIDTGALPASKSERYIEKIKEKFKSEKYYSRYRQNIDGRYNPLSPDEDFFLPISGRHSNTRIETLPGGQNLGDVDDVKYFRDKLLASLKIPKDYVVEKDQSPERKANLSQLDAKFARVIVRVQRSIEIGLEALAQRHLVLKGYPATIAKNLKIELPEPSDMYIKRRLDVDEQKARTVQAVKGLQIFPMDYIYREYYNLNDAEIREVKKGLEEEMQEMIEQQQMMAMAGMIDPAMMSGSMGMEQGAPPGEEQQIAEPTSNPEGMEPQENKPPTQNEQIDLTRKFLMERTARKFNKS